MNPFSLTKQPTEKIYTIVERIDSGKVRIQDDSKRAKTIAAGGTFSVGDRVLVVSGVLVDAVSKAEIRIIDV